MIDSTIRPAPQAFDAIASIFDERFSEWGSVSAQRRAVRTALLRRFPVGGRVLEIGGGTGEDAAFLSRSGFKVVLTDASPQMVEIANRKLSAPESFAEVVAAEDLERLAERTLAVDRQLFDGAFSNFAPLNCVADLNSVARALSIILKPGAAAMLVLFGTCCPGEILTEILRKRPAAAFRRFRHGPVPARLAKREFEVFYHKRTDILRAFHPWFVLEKQVGIGVMVPPSAAEPWISKHPKLLARLEAFDRGLARPLAALGDHVLYQFRRQP